MSLERPPNWPRGDRCPAWDALNIHQRRRGAGFDLVRAFAADPARVQDFTVCGPGLVADLSKQRWDRGIRASLLELAEQVGLRGQREALRAGARLNRSEGRAALHTALRAPAGSGAPFEAEVQAVLARFLAFAEGLRAEAQAGVRADGRPAIRHVINLGIGGSDLGPRLACAALWEQSHPGLSLHFASNADPRELLGLLAGLKPQETLFIVASKTFSTQETLANAQLARAWFEAEGGQDAARHFVATTANRAAAEAFGVGEVFEFWEWVGGRYSLWSAVGLPLAIALGAEGFRQLLAGAHAMDRHVLETPPEANLATQLGLLDVWLRSFQGCPTRNLAPYHQGLAGLPAWLQQLEMESNGKQVDQAGEPLRCATSPVIWGEAGTKGQHAFFQMLHQGGDAVPVEFLLVREPMQPARFGPATAAALGPALAAQQHALLANGLAQAQALMQGKRFEEAIAESVPTAAPDQPAEAIARHRRFPGNRPSTLLMLERLDAWHLGALLALYEHRVFTSAAVWGLNPFDQWGVELGKSLARDLLGRLATGESEGLDPSTAAAIRRLAP